LYAHMNNKRKMKKKKRKSIWQNITLSCDIKLGYSTHWK
jgi:hypothetical protein